MPKETIYTYGKISIDGKDVRVSKITSEEAYVPNTSKEVSFGKYSKKLPLTGKVKVTDLGRE